MAVEDGGGGGEEETPERMRRRRGVRRPAGAKQDHRPGAGETTAGEDSAAGREAERGP